MNLGVIRYKIWHDLWENKGRTLRVVAIIAIGAFAVGTVMGGKELILKDMGRTWQATNPATIGLSVEPAVDDTMLQSLEHKKEVDVVAGWFQHNIKWRRSPNEPWLPAVLVAVDDYENQPIRQIKQDDGHWPTRKFMGIQRGRNLDIGDQVWLEIDNKTYPVEMNGVLYNAAHPPPFVLPEPMFFTTRERFEQLTGESNYSLVLATSTNYTAERNLAAADFIQRELEKQGIEVNPAIPAPGGFRSRTSKPDRFIVQDALDGVFFMLTVMAIGTLLLGLFLVYNTINAIIVQQINQIGIMKAIGAKLNKILSIYFATVLVYALLALLVAVPLGALGANGLRLAMINQIKMIPGPFEISSTAVMFQALITLLAPLAIAIPPILTGARITVREAVSSYGLSGKSGLLDRLLVRWQFVPRTIALTISNTFRNKRQVMMTQFTLIGSGVIFLMVMNIRLSLVYTFTDIVFSVFDVNVMLDLSAEERIQAIETLSLAQPEVRTVEVWSTARGKVRRMGQPEAADDNNANLRGLPVPSTIYQPQLRAGRWFQPEDTNATVLSQALSTEIGVEVGDWITFDIPAKGESHWQVVGLVFEPLDQETAMMPRATLQKAINQVGRGKAVRVQSHAGDAAAEAAIADKLRELYESSGYHVEATTMDTTHRVAEQRTAQMSILIALLSGMAIMMAVVGAVALSGTLSLNVLERTREIGVMRAIGASSLVVAGQFVGEGLILGWLSWLLAIPLSYPLGMLVIKLLSSLMNIELIYQVSIAGLLYWFAIISVLAFIASWFPAQKAAKTSVRESLVYA